MSGLSLASLKSNYWGAVNAFSRSPTAIGAGAGGVYGATIGRDDGQSRLGGFIGGAAGGAVLTKAGMYGRAGFRDARNNMRLHQAMVKKNWASGAGVMPMSTPRAFARGARAAMSRDIGRSMDLIGKSGLNTNNGFNKMRGMFR